jgi:DNA-binding protein
MKNRFLTEVEVDSIDKSSKEILNNEGSDTAFKGIKL